MAIDRQNTLTPGIVSRRRQFESGLGILWFILGVCVVLFGLLWFFGDNVDVKSFWLMMLSGIVLFMTSAFILVPLPGRRFIAIVFALLTGFREYMLWAHGIPDSVDLAVVRSIAVFLLAIVTIVFYAIPRARARTA